MTTNGHQPTKILLYGDCAVPTGFGRINAAVGQYLARKGYQIMAADVQYDGLLPHPLPFWVAGLQGKDMGQGPAGWARIVGQIAGAYRPDIVISTQDFPYHIALRHGSGIDWSVTGHLVITPVDGAPIDPQWVGSMHEFDQLLTISRFGVETFKTAGQRVGLCPPGVDANDFQRLPDAGRAELRAKLGIAPDAFIVGVMAMNQGRKDYPSMVEGFAKAFSDAPDAYLYLDCDRESIAGWRIPDHLLKPNGIDPARVRFREDAIRAGLLSLNERYNLLDLHMVLAHREGYGLPHGEALATECPTVALDYCSGPEIVGANERGWLVPSKQGQFGTWGGARDYSPDMDALTAALREAYDNPAERTVRGKRGAEWVRTERSWDRAGEAVEAAIKRILEKRGADIQRKNGAQPEPTMQPPTPQIPAGVPMQHIIQLNAPIYVNGDNAAQVGAQIAQVAGQEAQRVLQENGTKDDA